MNRSEIFESFVKIAQEKGMIDKDAPQKAKKILEETGRADSLDISAIEALYGVKPDLPKGNTYKRNIIEDAHPNAVVISPSYDKLNGLVENNNERQDIILHILNKTPNGHLTQHKYAKKDLLLSLVRLGNDLDNNHQNELRALADTCLLQMTAVPFQKKGVAVAVIGVAALIGALYLQQHLSFANEGFVKNTNKLISEIDDLLNSNSDWGVGYKYSSGFLSQMSDFKDKITNFYNIYSKSVNLISQLEKPHTAQELTVLANQPETNSVIQAKQELSNAMSDFIPYLNKIVDDFKDENYKSRQIVDKGALTSLVDKTEILHGGHGLVADDFDDVVRAIPPYRSSVAALIDLLSKSKSIENKAKSELQMAEQSQAPEPKSVEDDLGIGQLEEDANDLLKNQ